MEIKKATDWDKVSIELEAELNAVDYNRDLQRMYRNIDKMVNELSALEVTSRSSQKYSASNKKLDEINNAIKHLESLLLMARLMQ
jgi:nucleosome binding factor SPN SPT16 subunit